MKTNRLLRILGEIDDDLISEAKPTNAPHTNSALLKTLATVACLALIALGGIIISQSNIFKKHPANTTEDIRWRIKEVYKSEIATSGELAYEPHWNEMSISQQFREVSYNGSNYSSRITKISAEEISTKLGTAEMKGYDTYTETTHTATASIYNIKNISSECVVALQFNGTNDYYVYVNSDYTPKTLGELVDNLSLSENLSFGSIWYNVKYDNGSTDLVEFPDYDDSVIWKMLLSETTLENVNKDTDMHIDLIGISVNISKLGYENISLGVTDEGYLTTNILDTRKVFYIGKEKALEFKDYILNNYTGYKIVYVDFPATAAPE